jgi:hypothetical protein
MKADISDAFSFQTKKVWQQIMLPNKKKKEKIEANNNATK